MSKLVPSIFFSIRFCNIKVHISQHIGTSQYRAQYSYVPVRLQLNDLIGFYSLDHRIAGENQPGLQWHSVIMINVQTNAHDK